MTFKEAKDKLRVIHRMTLTRTTDREFRVNYIGGKEATAYYTRDLDDAFTTAIDMRQRAKDEPIGARMPDGTKLDQWDERLRAAGGIPIYRK